MNVRFVEPDYSGDFVRFGRVLIDGESTHSQVSLRVRLGRPPVLLVDDVPVKGDWLVEREGADGTVRVVAMNERSLSRETEARLGGV